ncbi:hypothetical protein SAMN05443572_103165 [Myxococcus fulvus]|uniref:Uncharacterized protein n=1 Tax=Myxococcus fulvus TaxID=33 RepID=A0A511TE85_MYXFU|nr:hypothetical protein [Myxococcus fulvus]GEN12479.1 hypothetical protein MFU01_75160 [Myxococcus fulvus]SET77406.1 hypothetical protein SAMN05443572_103165 [Myxococcus fulvus]
MAEPAFIFGRVEAPGGIQPPPTRLPFVQGIIPLLLALVGGYQLLGLRTDTPEPPGLQGALLAGTLVCGVWGAVRMRRSLRLRAFAREHRTEPWLWDHPWTQETVAPQLATGPLLWPILGGLVIVGLLGAFGYLAPEVLRPDAREQERLGGGFMLLALTTSGLYVTWRFLLRAFYRRWKARRVFGRVSLRLPQIPLSLGGEDTVELLPEHDVPSLHSLTVTLRRIHQVTRTKGTGNSQRRITTRTLQHEHTQELDFEGLRADRPLKIPLTFLITDARSSTWRQLGEEVSWELAVWGSTEEEKTLEMNFRLPVYVTAATRL